MTSARTAIRSISGGTRTDGRYEVYALTAFGELGHYQEGGEWSWRSGFTTISDYTELEWVGDGRAIVHVQFRTDDEVRDGRLHALGFEAIDQEAVRALGPVVVGGDAILRVDRGEGWERLFGESELGITPTTLASLESSILFVSNQGEVLEYRDGFPLCPSRRLIEAHSFARSFSVGDDVYVYTGSPTGGFHISPR